MTSRHELNSIIKDIEDKIFDGILPITISDCITAHNCYDQAVVLFGREDMLTLKIKDTLNSACKRAIDRERKLYNLWVITCFCPNEDTKEYGQEKLEKNCLLVLPRTTIPKSIYDLASYCKEGGKAKATICQKFDNLYKNLISEKHDKVLSELNPKNLEELLLFIFCPIGCEAALLISDKERNILCDCALKRVKNRELRNSIKALMT